MDKFLGGVRLLGGVIFLGVCLSLLLLASARADNSSWLTDNLNIQKQADFTALPQSLNGNIDCLPENNACVINSQYGYGNQSGQVKLKGSSSYNDVISFVDNRVHTLAVPNSNTIINYTTEPAYGLYFYFTNNFSSSISLINNFGAVQYAINRAPDGKLMDKGGKRLAADYTSLNFSENSRWMVVSDPNVAVLRVNLDTFDVLPFGPTYNYTIGLSPSPHTAISNDGRWAAVASKDFDNFRLYDLDSCSVPVPSTIAGPQACQSRDLNSLLKQQVAGYVSVTNLKFISDDTLSAYVSYKEGSNLKVAKYVISTSQGSVNQLDYLALGDSYISGEGAYNYRPGTDTADSTCHLSLISYPLLIGRDLNFNSYNSAACSGAQLGDISNLSLEYRGQNKSRVPRKEYTDSQIANILTQFQVGYIDQLDFVTNYQPKIMTISIGGNNVGFSNLIKRCLEPDTCYSSYEDRLELVRLVNSNFTNLVNTYTSVKNNSAPDTRVYVIGYPQLANPNGNCALNVRLNAEELAFSKLFISYLDGVIKSAADAAGVTYIDTQSALDGHKLCEAEPGSVAVNGLTAGNDFPGFLGGPIGQESYHPNDLGHQLMEQYILRFSSNLTKPMPSPNPLSSPPPESGLEILQAPKSGRQINAVYYDDKLAPDTVFAGDGFRVNFVGSDYAVKPGSSFQAVINSTPIDLGTFIADSLGNLTATITIPSSLTPGFHNLHFYGQDINNRKIDINKVIYVAASANDYDGDGVPNDEEICQYGQTSGQDYDKDGIDDACDAAVSQPPPTSQNSPSAGDSAALSSALLTISSAPNLPGTAGQNPQIALELGSLPAAFRDAIASNSPQVLGASTKNTKPEAAGHKSLPILVGIIAGVSSIGLMAHRKLLNN